MKSNSKAFIAVVIGVITIAIVSGFIFIVNLSMTVRKESQNYLSEASLQNAAIIREKLENDLQTVQSVASLINGSTEKEFLERAELLRTHNGSFGNFQRIAIILPNGKGYVGENIEGFDFSKREYFKNALSGVSSISEICNDSVSGEPAIVYAVPVIQRGNIIGVVAALEYEKTYRKMMESNVFGGSGYSYIINKEGGVILRSNHPDSDVQFDNVFDSIDASDKDEKIMYNHLQSGDTDTLTYSARGKTRMLIYTPLYVNDWYLLSVLPYQVISEKTKHFMLLILIQSIIITGAVVILISYILLMEKRTQKTLSMLAFYDEMTGARNLNKFKTDAAALLSNNTDVIYNIIKLDIDKFKFLNELFGFTVGDSVLKNIAKAIEYSINPTTDIFARVSSDEFVIFIQYKGIEAREEMRQVFEHKFYELMGRDFQYKISFPTGRYLLEKGERDMLQIFEKVNMAHRVAKQDRNRQFVDYDNKMKLDALQYQEIESKMKQALQNGEFQLYLQPKYLLLNEKMVGAEALVRWKTKSGEMIFPSSFIPIFEKNGFITKLDFYMFEKACRTIRKWIDMGIDPVAISVNFSRLHLNSPGLVSELCRIADMYGVHRMYLEVELTETTLFAHGDVLVDFFTEVHNAGFTVSMDDFGTGYSSLGMLKNLPVDVVKIDRSFFVDAIDEERVKAVMSCIIEMTKRLGIHTVAEGVETIEHIILLRELGCDIVQGYYYSKPMPVDELTEKMRKHD